MILLIYTLIIFQILDGVSTYLALSSQTAVEANPIGELLINNFGLIPGIFVGKLVVILVLVLLSYSKPMSSKYRWSVLVILNILYCVVVINNFSLARWPELFMM